MLSLAESFLDPYFKFVPNIFYTLSVAIDIIQYDIRMVILLLVRPIYSSLSNCIIARGVKSQHIDRSVILGASAN